MQHWERRLDSLSSYMKRNARLTKATLISRLMHHKRRRCLFMLGFWGSVFIFRVENPPSQFDIFILPLDALIGFGEVLLLPRELDFLGSGYVVHDARKAVGETIVVCRDVRWETTRVPYQTQLFPAVVVDGFGHV